jgi:hypothetical protein
MRFRVGSSCDGCVDSNRYEGCRGREYRVLGKGETVEFKWPPAYLVAY